MEMLTVNPWQIHGSADGVCVLYRPTAGWYSQGSQVSHAKGAVEMMLGCSPVAFFHPHPPLLLWLYKLY